MAAMGSSGWNHQDQNLQPPADDDFHRFFEMQGMSNMGDGLNFADFQSFQDSSSSGLLPHAQREQMDTSMGGTEPSLAVPTTTAGLSREQMAALTTGASHPSLQAHMGRMPPTPTDSISDIDAQIQYLQQQRLQQQHRQMREQSTYYGGSNNRIIPPTPRSLELQPGTGQFFSPTETPMFDNRVHLKDTQQDMAFTPLVSPAVTPLDPHFNVDNAFSLPPTYFSPLTSPALHAQSDPNTFFSQHLQQGVVNTSSPVEMDLETNNTAPQEVTKKARKSSTSKAPRKTNVRQSPIAKPQRRKTASSSMANQVLNEAVELSSAKSRTSSPNDVANARRDDTDENNSVSPETLSEMPPPPLPPSKANKGKQAANGKQNKSAASNPAPLPLATMPSPATPASLMKLPSSSPSSTASSSNSIKATASPNGQWGQQAPPEHVDSMFKLPESVTSLPHEQFSPLGAPALSQSAEHGSSKTPSMPPMPSPAFGKSPGTASATQSPMLGPGATTPTTRGTPRLAPRRSKSRQGSITASPALLPKISPNIKPLLPGPGSENAGEEAASLLLTTKSNYQNILENNKIPGVSYPTELSTNLSSKRTSHKIAEQGRRNRINMALQEIAALLPAQSRDTKGSPDAEGKGAGTPGSKASTVEMAIDYIKQLKEEVEIARKRAEVAEEKLKMKGEGEPNGE